MLRFMAKQMINPQRIRRIKMYLRFLAAGVACLVVISIIYKFFLWLLLALIGIPLTLGLVIGGYFYFKLKKIKKQFLTQMMQGSEAFTDQADKPARKVKCKVSDSEQ